MTSEGSFPDVGRRLHSARLQRGLSQGTVARRAGIAASYLSRVETGKIHPTFRTLTRIVRALRAEIEEIVVPEPSVVDKRGVCPVSGDGRCLLDLIHSETEVTRGVKGEHYTPREIRLLRRMARWMRAAKPDRLRAMEILLEDLLHGAGDNPLTDDRPRSGT